MSKTREALSLNWNDALSQVHTELANLSSASIESEAPYSAEATDHSSHSSGSLSPQDIYITLGSPWVPTHVIDDFIEYLFYEKLHMSFDSREDYKVKHDRFAWEVPKKSRYGHSILAERTYGTSRVRALRLLELTLNMKPPLVYDTVSSSFTASGEASVLNEEETLMAIEKQKLLIGMFQEWVWTDQERADELVSIYESKYVCSKPCHYDGSNLRFPGMNTDVKLYPYQKDAVARILATPNTLLAHEVGSGKTYIMAAAGMKLLETGRSTKNLYVVPNNIVGQWEEIFLHLYPDANLLIVDPAHFKPAKRHAVLKNIRDNSYDAIIIAYSCFDMIPLSKRYHIEKLRAEIHELEPYEYDYRYATASLRDRLKKARQELSKLAVEREEPDRIFFDDLGISALFIDEAHNYKNVPLYSKGEFASNMRSGTKKGRDMMNKVHYVQSVRNGGGVVMATGTPITNSVSDIYVMQMYLQSGELAFLGLQTIDNWAGMFAERSVEFEIDIDTNRYKLNDRLSRFHNIPELTAMIASFADFHRVDESNDIPKIIDGDTVLLDKPAALDDFLKSISARTTCVRNKSVSRKKDNLLKITVDGRMAALDMRLIDSEVAPEKCFKVFECADKVTQLYRETQDNLGTQVVFCDISTPKSTFNLYDELKKALMGRGISADEIAFIHDAASERARQILFDKVRRGEVRVLIGSTMKLGLGVNIQDRLIAVHHLDVPWRPADMTQREGRILRQGNLNKEVHIFRYVTEGSFDAYSWQILERKQRFISNLLSGTALSRSSQDDIDKTVLSYAEVKALAIGNPTLKERCDVENELRRYQALQRKFVASGRELQDRLKVMQSKIEKQEQRIQDVACDAQRYAYWKEQHPAPRLSVGKEAEKTLRDRVRLTLGTKLVQNLSEHTNRYGCPYKGFDIWIPGDITFDEPYLILSGKARYQINLKSLSEDPLPHLDSTIGQLDRRVQFEKDRFKSLQTERINMIEELQANNYIDKILELKHRLNVLDEILGVNSHEKAS